MPDIMETWKIVYSYKNFTHINNNNIIININIIIHHFLHNIYN